VAPRHCARYKKPTDYIKNLNKMQKQNQDKNTSGINSSKKSAAENMFYFTIEKQKEWERIDGPFGSFMHLTPWQHFCRKNIGYLYAILHGAEDIFDFDDENFIKLDSICMPLQILLCLVHLCRCRSAAGVFSS